MLQCRSGGCGSCTTFRTLVLMQLLGQLPAALTQCPVWSTALSCNINGVQSVVPADGLSNVRRSEGFSWQLDTQCLVPHSCSFPALCWRSSAFVKINWLDHGPYGRPARRFATWAQHANRWCSICQWRLAVRLRNSEIDMVPFQNGRRACTNLHNSPVFDSQTTFNALV